MALSVISLLRSDSVAFGCEADMRTVDRSNQSDVNDPGCVKTVEAFVGAQPKNRTCGLSESFMRGRHPVRIYLARTTSKTVFTQPRPTRDMRGSRLSHRKSIVRSFAKAWYHPSIA